MSRVRQQLWDASLTVGLLLIIFFINLLLQKYFDISTLVPMIFVLGVFLISLKTQGYFWGIFASMASVLLMNYAFTAPYFRLNLLSAQSLASAVIMLAVAALTSMLTTKIKKQEKMKAESEKERMRANLLRAISHDLRTPLTTIYGSCSTILENYDSLSKEQQLKLLGETCQDAECLIRMVENLLSITRIDAEKVEVKKTPIVLEELIDSVLLKFRKQYPEIDTRIEIPDDFVIIPMDGILIEQVLLNLLQNAAIHAEGMTQLHLRVTCRKGYAIFEISDDGCGIAHDRLPHLFTGHYIHNNVSSDFSRRNMGIGLTACAAIVKAHGGEIDAFNRKEGGACFRFTLQTETMTADSISLD